jgi:hypothetical protein
MDLELDPQHWDLELDPQNWDLDLDPQFGKNAGSRSGSALNQCGSTTQVAGILSTSNYFLLQ